ncbi:MAG: carboxypeptidase M32 [Anaerolineales bacterium]|jgi:carboxypeptidase Taq
MTDNLEKLRELLGLVSDLGHAAALLGWDQQTYMPPGGAGARAMQLATLSTLAHDHFVSDEMGAAIEGAKSEVKDLDPDSNEVRLVRKAERDYLKEVKVPSSWVAEYSRVTAMAHQDWEHARAESDFKRFEPHLKKIVELRRQYADFFKPYDHVYDPLLDDFEPGMKTEEVKAVFETLRKRQVPLVQAILEEGKPVDDSVMHKAYDIDKQWDFGIKVIKAFGYDFQRGRQDKSVHPFTTGFGIDDVRITTRFDEHYLPTGLTGTMHEAGHAMYEQGIDKTLERTPLAGGASLAMHESQSRMWENLVGRSKPFWQAYLPELKKVFPAQLGDISLDAFYRAMNKVERTFIRVDADEATYNLHVMLRFELEIALMEGDLAVSDLPEAWNETFEAFLGILPPDDARGVLQDVHWSGGMIGYFPTYSLGNLIAAQLWEKIHQDLPDLDEQIVKAEFDGLLGWLRENIHRHGSKYEPIELLQKVTGQGLEAEPYLRYLENKYRDIYEL